MRIEHFIAVGSVEALDVSILVRFTGLDVIQLGVVLVRLVGEDLRQVLWSLICTEGLRHAAPLKQPV